MNLSPLQVRDRTIIEMVRSSLAESGVAPSRLVLEITEGVLIDDPDEIDLHALGVRVWHSMTSDRAIPISVIFSVFQSRLTGALSQRLVAHPTVA